MSQPKSKLENQPKIDSYLLKGNHSKKTYLTEDSQNQETRLSYTMSQPSTNKEIPDMSEVKPEELKGSATKGSLKYSLVKKTPKKFKKQLSVREILKKFEDNNVEEPVKKKLGLRTITPIKKRKMSHNTSNKLVNKTPDKKFLSVKAMLKMYERNHEVQNKPTESQSKKAE